MKTTLSLLAIPLVATSPLFAQDGPKEGQELLDLFERMHRDGATEEDLRKFLGDKPLLDLEVPDSPDRRDDRSEERQKLEDASRKQVERGQFRKLDLPEASEWKIGLLVEPVAPFIREHLGLDKNEGVRVVQVADGSPAARVGLEVNDIIVSAGDRKISNLDDLKQVVERAGREGQQFKIGWIHKGERKGAQLRPEGPPPQVERKRDQSERDERAGDAAQRPALIRRMEEMARRMEKQQREIEDLRREIEKLKRDSQPDE